MAALQGLVDGILFAGILAAIAVGFTLAFGVADVANFAHGDFVTLGMYAGWVLYDRFTVSPLLTALLCLPAGQVLGAVLFWGGIGRVQRSSRILQMVITLGYLLIIENLLLYFFSASEHGIDVSASEQAVRVGSIGVSVASIIDFVMGLALVVVTAAFLRFTRFGLAIRAYSQSDLGARLVKLPVTRAQIAALGWSLAMAMFAGALLIQTQPVVPSSGLPLTLEAFLVAVVGGLGSVSGAVVGSLVYGVASGVLSGVVSPVTANIITIASLIVALALAPGGIVRLRSAARSA